MLNRRRLPVHHSIIHDHIGAECVPDALMPQTNAKNWNLSAEMPNHVIRETALAWRTGTRRNQNPLWLHLLDSFQRNLIVAMHLHRHIHLAQILDEIVSERIVIIQNQHHAALKVECAASIGESHLPEVN